MTLTGKTAAMFAAAEALQNPKPAKKREDREGPIHMAILDYLRLALPGALIHHSPNEMGVSAYIAGDDPSIIARIRNALRKAILRAIEMGMLPGFPDFIIFWKGRLLAIEAKAAPNKPSPTQIDVGALIERNGGTWAVAYSLDDAVKIVTAWRKEV